MDDELRNKIIGHYQKGQGSIQDIARVYHLSVDQVLEAIGIKDISHAAIGGDLIDPSEVGPGATFNYGQSVKIDFTTN